MLLRSGLVGLVSVMSACVLPITPEFQDPPSAANYAPVILSAMPDIGSLVTATNPSAVPTFTIYVQDPNLGDDLHVRWIADYPPDTANTRFLLKDFFISHSSNGMLLNAPSSVTPSCIGDLAKTLPQHQIMAVVADRPFDDSLPPPNTPVDLTKLSKPEGRKVIATWILNVDCTVQ
jgi:hypothetical protein